MLQWMGGSRRKVTTSRKSTHKRQKQYFEQRKRQQQKTAILDIYADGKSSSTLHGENNRSLDILCLENVSAAAQDKKIRSLTARDISEDDDFTSNHQCTHPRQAILTNQGIPIDQSEILEERISLSCGTEPDTKKVSVHLPDHSEGLVGDKLDPFKLSATHQLSVIDLLGDGGANTNEEENSEHAQEAHVAFSIEGLGKVDTETPVHSPKMPCKSFPNGFSTQQKASRQPRTSKHLAYDFYDLDSTVGIDFSHYECSIEQPFRSREMMNVFEDPNQKLLKLRNSPPSNCNGNTLVGSFGNEELIYNIRDSGRNICNVGPNFLEDNIDDLGGYQSFCKNWMDQRNVGYRDYFNIKDLWKQDIFEDWNLQEKRSSTKRSENFFATESPAPYPKHQIAEDLPDVIIPDMRWYSAIERDDDGKDAVNRLIREDTTESLSLLSEESCSSTAVRGDATTKS